MAGLERDTPAVTALTLHQASRVLEIGFADGTSGPLVGGAILGRLHQIVATWQLSQRAAATPAPGPEDEP